MANHASSKKRIRRNNGRAVVNGARRSRIRTSIKKVEAAIASGSEKDAKAALQAAQPLPYYRSVSEIVLRQNCLV